MENYPITNHMLDTSTNFEAVQAVLNNKFDINFDYLHSKSKNATITMHHSEEVQNERLSLDIVDDKSIIYNYNQDHFRCDEFNSNHSGKHIVFSGCSETEGVGANIEENWSYKLYSEISQNEKTSGYYNLGLSGSGYLKIINNLMIYIEKFGKPDLIFILFPNIARWTEWIDDRNGYAWIGLDPFNPKPVDVSRASDEKTLMVNSINFTSTLRLFEKYCESSGIKLFWSTWDGHDEKTYNTLVNNQTFKSFVPMNMLDFHLSLSNNILTKKDFIKTNKNLFRRDTHLGNVYHDYFSNVFLSAYSKEMNNANL